MSTDLIKKAIKYAAYAHRAQVRKDGVTPYICHPYGVYRIAMSYGCDEDQLIAALLHDTVEDTEVTIDDIRISFGDNVARLVWGLTTPDKSTQPGMNRAARKEAEIQRLLKEPDDVILVKLADIEYNINDCDSMDRGFAFRFLDEKKDLLTALACNLNLSTKTRFKAVDLVNDVDRIRYTLGND